MGLCPSKPAPIGEKLQMTTPAPRRWVASGGYTRGPLRPKKSLWLKGLGVVFRFAAPLYGPTLYKGGNVRPYPAVRLGVGIPWPDPVFA
jgi:hypothetical protein